MIKSFSPLKLFELLENTELISHRGGDPADAETGRGRVLLTLADKNVAVR